MELDSKFIRAAALFVADNKDCRHVLQSVYVEVQNSRMHVVATDGAALFHWAGSTDLPSGKWLIDVTTVKSLPKGFLTLNVVGDVLEITTGAIRITVPANERVFPDFRWVIPKSCSGELAQYDLEILANVAKAAKLLGAKHPGWQHLHFNGTGPGVIQPWDGVTIIGMPMRESGTSDEQRHYSCPV